MKRNEKPRSPLTPRGTPLLTHVRLTLIRRYESGTPVPVVAGSYEETR